MQQKNVGFFKKIYSLPKLERWKANGLLGWNLMWFAKCNPSFKRQTHFSLDQLVISLLLHLWPKCLLPQVVKLSWAKTRPVGFSWPQENSAKSKGYKNLCLFFLTFHDFFFRFQKCQQFSNYFDKNRKICQIFCEIYDVIVRNSD